jgi:hypothetical protein
MAQYHMDFEATRIYKKSLPTTGSMQYHSVHNNSNNKNWLTMAISAPSRNPRISLSMLFLAEVSFLALF